ncbi:hypothetical protein IAE34_20470 [Pseudomonas sp. S30]|nr:hypothetical protein [Pseudomonas sp. S30]
MAKRPETVLGEAYASSTVSPTIFDHYRARFADHWSPYGDAPLMVSPGINQWHLPEHAASNGPSATRASANAFEAYPWRFPPAWAPYAKGPGQPSSAAVAWQFGKPVSAQPTLGHTVTSAAAASAGSTGRDSGGVLELPPIEITAEPEPRIKPSRSVRKRKKETPRRSTVVEPGGTSRRVSQAEVTSRPALAPSEPTRLGRAVAEAQGGRSGTVLDIALKGAFTTFNAGSAEQQLSGYASAVGAPLAGLAGKTVGAYLFPGAAGKVASEVGGIALSMAADKAGPSLAKALLAKPPTAQGVADPAQVDPYSKMMRTLNDAAATTAVVGTAAAGWEATKQRLWKQALPSLVSQVSKGPAYNPVTWLAAEGAAKWAYTAATAKTAEERGAGYGGAVGGVLLGAGVGAALTSVGLAAAAPVGVMIGNFLGDQIGSAVGGYLGATFFSSEPEDVKGAADRSKSVTPSLPASPNPDVPRVIDAERPADGTKVAGPSSDQSPALRAATSLGKAVVERQSIRLVPPVAVKAGKAVNAVNAVDVVNAAEAENAVDDAQPQPATTSGRQGWPPVISSPSLAPGVMSLPNLDIRVPAQSRQVSSRSTSAAGLPRVSPRVSQVPRLMSTVPNGPIAQLPVDAMSHIPLGSAIGQPSTAERSSVPTVGRGMHHLVVSRSVLGTPAGFPVVTGFSALPAMAPEPVDFPVAVSLQAPATELAVPPATSRLPKNLAPAQPARGAAEPPAASPPVNFTTHIPITVQAPAVTHDQLALDLEAAVRSVLEKRQRAEEARLADPLRLF